jgi:putative membrane protein
MTGTTGRHEEMSIAPQPISACHVGVAKTLNRVMMGAMNMIGSSRVAAMLGIAALVSAGHWPGNQSAKAADTQVQYAVSPSALAANDATFINLAAVSGVEDVSFAQLAQTNSSNPAVDRFAAEMVRDHTLASQQLLKLADAKAMATPNLMDATHQALYQQLGSSKGSGFDGPYIDTQIKDQVAAVQLFEAEAQTGTDPDVRGFAQHYLPMMQQHLEMAQALKGAE